MIPFLDLHKLNAPYKAVFQKKFERFIASGHYILGEAVRQFEKEFAGYCGANFCVGTGNGLDALKLILCGYMELGRLHQGQKVMVAANTHIATLLAVKQAGMELVLVEPDEKTFTLAPEEVRQNITPKTEAILVTHLYGQLADMKVLSRIALKNNLLLIADAAQAHGALSQEEGPLADATGYSFYPTKNLGALGDAGAVTTDDKQLAKVIAALRNYGASAKNEFKFAGYNSRLDELQAVFLLEKLKDLEAHNTRRRAIAKRYFNEIKNEKIRLPFWEDAQPHVFHLFVVRVENRAEFCAYLDDNHIGYLVHYPIPPHQQKAFSDYAEATLPITEKIHKQVVSIPLNPTLSEADVNEIITVLNRY